MKIQRLTLKNINSLTGGWEIDFTDPAYSECGFFAITGPTGAGKSSILDAICLALYGKTPRLGKITQSSNDLMSTNAADCMAEVVFSTDKGVFSSGWSQKKARMKPDGALQAPVRQCTDEMTGAVIETRTREIDDLIEEYTGMDFERFSRTMMLAQGDFAAFLNAPEKDRSDILEQITGTEVYSDLSKMVFTRSREEDKRVENLEKEYLGVYVLSSEERESAERELHDLRLEREEGEASLAAVHHALRWHSTFHKLVDDRTQLLAEKNAFLEDEALFAPERDRLERALQARRALPEYTRLSGEREHEKDLLLKRADDLARRPVIGRQIADAEARESRLRTELMQAQQELEGDRQVAKTVRDLDTRIRTASDLCSGYSQGLFDLTRQQEEADNALREMQGVCREKEDQHREAAAYLEEHRPDARLREEYSGIENQYEEYESRKKSLEELDRSLEQLALDLPDMRKRVLDLTLLVNEQKEHETSLGEEIADHEALLHTIREGLSGTGVHDRYTALVNRKTGLETLLDELTRIERLEARAQKAEEETQRSLELLERQNRDLSLQKEEEARHTETLTRLQESVREAELAVSAGSLRKDLAPGRPCPVCGSLHHPFAGQDLPTPGPLEHDSNAVSELRDKARNATLTLEKGISATLTKLDGYRKEGEEISTELTQALQQWAGRSSLLGLDPGHTDRRLLAAGAIRACDEELKQVEEARLQQKNLEKELKDLEKARDAHLKTERESLELLHEEEKRLEKKEETARITRDERQVLEEERRARHAKLVPVLQAYGVLPDVPQKTALRALRERKDRYFTCKQAETDLAGEIRRIGDDIRHMESTRAGLAKRCHETAQRGVDAKSEMEALVEKRTTLYGMKDPDTEETRLLEAVTQRKVGLSEAEEECKGLGLQRASLETSLVKNEEAHKELVSRISGYLQEFTGKITICGFSSEQEFVSFLLPEDRFEDLSQKDRALKNQALHLQARLGAKEKELSDHESLRPGTETREIQEAALVSVQSRLSDLNTRIYEQEALLATNEKQEKEAQELSERLRVMKTQSAVWSRLNSLIGSSDGKKFRSYAQGLTLAVLLSCANQHMSKLTDRYVLVQKRDETKKDESLGIEVIDMWRAKEIRPTRNLSGGETFIVSLALALGLSAMVSRNVRVDSLFLDEGFGTLDEESLDTALSALGSLMHEGKLIGVISHVQALKDKVPVQIQVEKRSGGKSRLTGPGCRETG